jgi:hypothetical protein
MRPITTGHAVLVKSTLQTKTTPLPERSTWDTHSEDYSQR